MGRGTGSRNVSQVKRETGTGRDRNHGETTFNYGTEGRRVRRGERTRKNEKGAAWIRGTTNVFNYICSTPQHRCLITPRCREARLPRNALAVSMPRLVFPSSLNRPMCITANSPNPIRTSRPSIAYSNFQSSEYLTFFQVISRKQN